MTLTHILVFSAAAILYLALLPQRWRKCALFLGSVVAIYWLQPATKIDKLDFIFPTATLGLVGLAWLLSRGPEQRITREDSITAAILIVMVLILSFGRNIEPEYWPTADKPPSISNVAIGLAVMVVLLGAVAWLPLQRRTMASIGMVFILGIFIVLKTEGLAEELAARLRAWQNQPTSLATASELEWLGFSYIAFRFIHTLRDRQTGRLPELTLREYVTYAIFFPSFTAGPIDRAERFLTDLQDLPGVDTDRLVQGSMRIVVGIGKKFIIADSLAYFTLTTLRADQATTTFSVWVLVYTYALQIYFDFSGYSDIAIGIGQLFGIKLPENFNLPYLKRNITQFWQSWHMTLSNWVRFYVFSPLTRYLLKRKHKPSPTVLALVGQVTTMIVIGLWHGVTWGFVVWGLWHGIGLFIHKVWSDRTRRYYIQLRDYPRLGRAVEIAGVVLTFHFVVLGWVWFALPDIESSWDVFLRLFGL